MNKEEGGGGVALPVVDIQKHEDIGSRIDKTLFMSAQRFHAHSSNQSTYLPIILHTQTCFRAAIVFPNA
jgi:hypothetical protein